MSFWSRLFAGDSPQEKAKKDYDACVNVIKKLSTKCKLELPGFTNHLESEDSFLKSRGIILIVVNVR